jgi:hypothetical protein
MHHLDALERPRKGELMKVIYVAKRDGGIVGYAAATTAGGCLTRQNTSW